MIVRPPTDLVVELAVDTISTSIDKFEGVRPIAVHVTVAVGQTSIAEQKRHLHMVQQDKRRKMMRSPAKFSVQSNKTTAAAT